MSGNESFVERQKAELEFLKSCFDSAVSCTGQEIIIKLVPFHDSQIPEVHTQIDMHVILPDSYPAWEPEIQLKNSKGLSTIQIQTLQSKLEKLAKELKGEVMIYNLTSCVQDYLSENNKPGTKSFYDEMVTRKEQMRQAKDKSEEHKKTKKILDLQEKVNQKTKLLEEESSDEGEDLKHVTFSCEAIRTKLSSGSLGGETEPICEHKSVKYITFTNKVLRGRCIEHNVNSIIYCALDNSSGELLRVHEWVLKPRSKEKDAVMNFQKQLESINQELNYLKKLKHENILNYVDFKYTQEKDEWVVYILQEYISNTSINVFRSKNLYCDINLIRALVIQVLGALSYLHHQSIVHKNLKESCIYLNKQGVIKLSDYCLIKRVDDLYQSCNFGVSASSKEKLTSKTDIKQLGRMLLRMYGVTSSPEDKVMVPDYLPSELKDFIEKCLIENEEKRWSAKQLMGHKFIKMPLTKELKPRRNFANEKRSDASPEEEMEESDALFSQPIPNDLKFQSRLAYDFKIMKYLGSGSFGKVLKAKMKLDGCIYAIKEIELNPRNKQLNRKMIREVKLLSKLNHENVVRYYNSWIETTDVNDSSLVTNVTSTPLQTLTDIQSYKALENGDTHDTQIKSSDSQRDPEKYYGSEEEEEEEDDEEDEDEEDYEEDDEDEDEDEEWNMSSLTRNEPTKSKEESSFITFAEEGGGISKNSVAEEEPDKIFEPNKRIRMYIQMEFCEKSTLRNAIDDHICNDINLVWRFFREIVEGLSYIHEQDMIHRDLKPVNIFLDSDDHVKIGDFGLATTSVISKPTLIVTGMSLGESDDQAKIANYEESHTGGVGTSFYVAPELKKAFGKLQYNKKVDIYSLGIIFFEMCHPPFGTDMERCVTLSSLRTSDIVIPAAIEQKMPQQMELVRQLLNHDPMSRPSCQEILESDILPPPLVEEEELQEFVRYTLSNPQSKAYKYLISSCFDQKVTMEEDLTYHLENIPSEKVHVLQEAAKECLEKILKKHGAVYLPTPLLLPKSDVYSIIESGVKLMTHSGSIVTLPFDLRVPFARHVSYNQITRLRRYAIDRVYREKKVHGFHPKELYECVFDIVTSSSDNLMVDSEMLSVINEVVNEIPSLRNRNCVLRLNHSLLLRSILSHFGVEGLYTEIIQILVATKNHKTSRTKLETNLAALMLGEQITATLATFLYKEEDTVKKMETNFLKLFSSKRSEASSLAKKGFEQLKTIISNAEALGLNIPIKITLSVVYNIDACTGIMFDLVCQMKQKRRKEGFDVLASGCRYDGLLAKFRSVFEVTGMIPRDITQAAVGMSISLDKIASVLSEDNAVMDCVVVSSLGHCDMAKTKAELAKNLWASGVKCFIEENIDTLEELQNYCQENNVTHIVTVKESERGIVRVRSWEKEKERYQEKKISISANLSEVTDYILRYSKNTSESTDNLIALQRQESKACSFAEQTAGPQNLSIHIIAEDKMSASTRRRYEIQINSRLSPILGRFSARASLEVIGVFLDSTNLKMIAANLEITDDSKDCTVNIQSSVDRNHKKYVTKICDKIQSLNSEKSNMIIILYSIQSDKYKLVISN